MRFLLIVLLALMSARAEASPLLELSGGFGGTGGLQARHTGAAAASSYFNPALLTRARTGLTVGLLVLNTNIAVRVAKRDPENAVPDGLLDAFHEDGSAITSKPVATEFLQNGKAATAQSPALTARPRQGAGSGDQTLTYGAIGVVLKLLKERLALGFYGLVPLKSFLTMRSFYVDEREQYMSNSLHPEMYGDRLTALSFAFAAGVKVSDSFSLGVGATMSIDAYARAPVYVANASELTNLDLNLDIRAKVALTPHAGVAWDPGKRWHLTATVHAPQHVDVISDFKFLIGTNEQSSGIAFTYFYQPWQASAGLGYDFYARGDQTWGLSGQMLYQRWSQYIDRQSVRPEKWRDTFTGALGLRGQSGPFSIGLDAEYKPTPVPAQTGRTNYVDNDRLGSALVLAYAFQVREIDFKLGAQLQLFRLLTRSVRKTSVVDEVPDDAVRSGKPVEGREGLQTNNPGWPGYQSLGWVSAGGLYLSILL